MLYAQLMLPHSPLVDSISNAFSQLMHMHKSKVIWCNNIIIILLVLCMYSGCVYYAAYLSVGGQKACHPVELPAQLFNGIVFLLEQSC